MAGARRVAGVLAPIIGSSTRAVAVAATAIPMVVLLATTASSLPAQSTALGDAMQLEMAGRNREAVAAYRLALSADDMHSALLGLERAYAALGWTDSLLPTLDSLIGASPGDDLLRAVQLRALLMAGHETRAGELFRSWVARSPADPQPYRDYSRLLLDNGRYMAADSVLRAAQTALGSGRDVALELAQLRAQLGLWELSAQSWRVALRGAEYLRQAALFSLQPTPAGDRDAVRAALRDGMPERAARQTLARLELAWGDATAGWRAISPLAADDSSVEAWSAYAEEADAAGAHGVAAEALIAAVRARPSATLAARAAAAALRVGRVREALELTEGEWNAADGDGAAQALLPVRVRALSAAGRPADAERLAADVAATDPLLAARLQGELAWAWVRAGDVERARAALARAGADPHDEVHGWLALYSGDLAGARELLRATPEAPTDAVTVLAMLGRTTADSAPLVGTAFLTLARGDSVGAATAFVRAAVQVPDAASLLLAMAGRLAAAAGDDSTAVAAWRTVAEQHATSPEAAEVELAWARLLLARGDTAAAAERLERLIIEYPGSALVPQARRELEATTSGRPPTRSPRPGSVSSSPVDQSPGGAQA